MEFEQDKILLESELLFLYKYYYAKAIISKNVKLKQDAIERIKKSNLEASNAISFLSNNYGDNIYEDVDSILDALIQFNKEDYSLLASKYINALNQGIGSSYDEFTQKTPRYSINSILCGWGGGTIEYVEKTYEKQKKALPFLPDRYVVTVKTYPFFNSTQKGVVGKLNCLKENGFLVGPKEYESKTNAHIHIVWGRTNPYYMHFDLEKIKDVISKMEPIVLVYKNQKAEQLPPDVKKRFGEFSSPTKKEYYNVFGTKIQSRSFEEDFCGIPNKYGMGIDITGYIGLFAAYKFGNVLSTLKNCPFDMKKGIPSYEDMRSLLTPQVFNRIHSLEKFIKDYKITYINEESLKEQRLRKHGFSGNTKIDNVSIPGFNKQIEFMKNENKQLDKIRASKKINVIPEYYQTPEAIAKMAFLYINKRANNITELINVYEQTIWQEKMLKSMENINTSLNRFEESVNEKLGLMLQNQQAQNNKLNTLINAQQDTNKKLEEIKIIDMKNAKQLADMNQGISNVNSSINNVKNAIDNLDLRVDVRTTVYL